MKSIRSIWEDFMSEKLSLNLFLENKLNSSIRNPADRGIGAHTLTTELRGVDVGGSL